MWVDQLMIRGRTNCWCGGIDQWCGVGLAIVVFELTIDVGKDLSLMWGDWHMIWGRTNRRCGGRTNHWCEETDCWRGGTDCWCGGTDRWCGGTDCWRGRTNCNWWCGEGLTVDVRGPTVDVRGLTVYVGAEDQPMMWERTDCWCCGSEQWCVWTKWQCEEIPTIDVG